MDFTGSGGRIVTDPREAAEIAHMESRLRPTPRFTWSSSPSSDMKEDSPPVPGQAWFKPGVTRDQANNALLPHRALDGVFLIRDCSRGQGGYVLSLTTQGKVVHAQIVRVSESCTFFWVVCVCVWGGGSGVKFRTIASAWRKTVFENTSLNFV